MMIPRVLLLTHVLPGRSSVGELYLRDLVQLYPKGEICCFTVSRTLIQGATGEKLGGPIEWAYDLTATPWPSYDQKVRRGVKWARQWCLDAGYFPYLARRVARFGKRNHVDLLWVTMGSPATIMLARRVQRLLGTPLVLTVWDPPKYKLEQQYAFDRYTLARHQRAFEAAVRVASRCGVASFPMKRHYESAYGTDCIPMPYAVQRSSLRGGSSQSGADRTFVIGYAGSIYAHRELNALLGALASQDWCIGNRKVHLKVLAPSISQQAPIPLRIEFLGWRSQREVMDVLSRVDLAYLPYWFDADHEEVVRLAFPGKLCTYVAARVPVLYHGPRRSSVTEFMQRYPVGISCHTLDFDGVIASLSSFIERRNLYERSVRACDRAYAEELSVNAFHRSFWELLGVTEEDVATHC